jgi:hypothetical protein
MIEWPEIVALKDAIFSGTFGNHFKERFAYAHF